MNSPFHRSPEQEALVADWDPPQIDTTKPHPARIYDYFLGGKTHFPADRAAAATVVEDFPQAPVAARANRDFLARAVGHLARSGVRQFLDVGTGIPTSGNTHEVAQAVNPAARVVYTDNDPIVLAHARALLSSHPDGRTAYLHADLRDPESIFGHPELKSVLDPDEPIALILAAVLHFVPDADHPAERVAALCRGLPPGSRLVVSHVSADLNPAVGRAAERAYNAGGIPTQPRSRDEVHTLLADAGITVYEPPGLVLITDWHPEPATAGTPAPAPEDVSIYGGIARVPAHDRVRAE